MENLLSHKWGNCSGTFFDTKIPHFAGPVMECDKCHDHCCLKLVRSRNKALRPNKMERRMERQHYIRNYHKFYYNRLFLDDLSQFFKIRKDSPLNNIALTMRWLFDPDCYAGAIPIAFLIRRFYPCR